MEDMDFEPLHSDDEDGISFMPEKKKRDGSEKRKKPKGVPLFKADKKATYNDINSPIGTKHKHSVHGVVGPADYIFDQGSPPNSEAIPVSGAEVTEQTPVELTAVTQTTVNSSQRPSSIQWPNSQSTGYQHQSFQKPTFSTQSVPVFQPTFPPVMMMSTKIERPHSSAALVQERHLPQTPTPFKQQQTTTTSQKQTLLAQAMSSNQFQSTPPNVKSNQMTSCTPSHQTHQRNQSYSRAMSVPILSKPDTKEAPFHAKFESSLEINTSLDFPNQSSLILESTSPISTAPPNTPPLSPSHGRPTSEEFWSQTPSKYIAEEKVDSTEWAHFSHVSASSQDEDVQSDENIGRRKSHENESLPESIPDSVSSIESDLEESVWKINDEQREYYTEQFKKIQPNDGEIIKGLQARDFFLKSNLPNETLSKIWHLSDLDKDFGLNLEEFCIAMHLVVAVRHGVELPQTLPVTLLPFKDEDPFNVQLTSVKCGSYQTSAASEEKKAEWAADFDGQHLNSGELLSTASSQSSIHNDVVQTLAQPSSPTSTIPVESRIQPVSSQQNDSENTLSKCNYDLSQSNELISTEKKVNTQAVSPKLRHNSTPIFKETISAIARPRASANKNVNLMDASPWQLLPPPSSKSKQTIKKSVDGTLGSDSSLASPASNESVDTLVTIERSPAFGILGIKPLSLDDSDEATDDNERHKVRNQAFARRLSKEKSRSIDSLRSDISESSEFQWRRQSKRDSRRRSYTGSFTENMQEKTKEFEIPPTPPPRHKGHARASSLDLNQILNAKSSPDSKEVSVAAGKTVKKAPKPQKPPRSNIPSKLSASTSVLRSRETAPIDSPSHRRSSLDSEDVTLDVSNSQVEAYNSTTDDETIRKRIGAEPLPNKTSSEAKNISKEHGVRFSEETKIIGKTKSPIEKRMRKNELQSRIRELKSKNTTLISLNGQLDMEWKEISEFRIALDVQLQKYNQQG